MRILKWLPVAILFCAAQASYAQGLMIVEEHTRDGNTVTNLIEITKTRIRAEYHLDDVPMAIIYDSTAQVARVLNLAKRTYVEVTKAQLDQMRQDKPDAPVLQYRRNGSDKANYWRCSRFEAYRDTEKIREVCTIDLALAHLTAADFAITRQFDAFARTLVPQAEDQVTAFGALLRQGYAGIPVRKISFADGKPVATTLIKEMRQEDIPAVLFKVPPGFTKEP